MHILTIARARTSLAGFAAIFVAACSGSYGGDGGSRQPATLAISISPMTITLGESATITWNSNGNSCTASDAWTGSKPGSGSESVTPTSSGTHTYALTCGGGGYRESDAGSVTLTVDAAARAGLVTGSACCIEARPFAVAGVADGDGNLRLMAAGRHFVGVSGKAPAVFAVRDSGLAAGRLDDVPAFQLLEIAAPGPLHAGKAGLEAAQGSFTTHLGTRYALTLNIDGAGELTGADTAGCMLHGRMSALAGARAYRVWHDVTGCGMHDGRYEGLAAIVPGDAGRPMALLLSTSNAQSAIGWQLTR